MVANDPEDRKGRLKNIGGSQSDHWNNTLTNQAVQSLWMKNSSPEERDKQLSATVAALMGIGPKDELEGMMAAQLVAAHNAAMECYRRAMIGEQSFEGRRENLAQANKLSRTYATLARSPQPPSRQRASKRSRSSTSTSMPGDRPLSARSQTGGWGCQRKSKATSCTSTLPMHLSPRCGAKTRSGSPCRSPAMPNGRCRMHGGGSPGAPKGEANGNYRHGRFTNEAIERRRELNEWARLMKKIAEKVE